MCGPKRRADATGSDAAVLFFTVRLAEVETATQAKDAAIIVQGGEQLHVQCVGMAALCCALARHCCLFPGVFESRGWCTPFLAGMHDE